MDALIDACVATDAELSGLEPAAARVRARDRLQQRHQRVRVRLLRAIRGLVSSGRFNEDEGRDAERWLALLKRRQNSEAGPS